MTDLKRGVRIRRSGETATIVKAKYNTVGLVYDSNPKEEIWTYIDKLEREIQKGDTEVVGYSRPKWWQFWKR